MKAFNEPLIAGGAYKLGDSWVNANGEPLSDDDAKAAESEAAKRAKATAKAAAQATPGTPQSPEFAAAVAAEVARQLAAVQGAAAVVNPES